MKKAGDFAVALVIYVMRCIKDGETERPVRMGFGPAEIEELALLRSGTSSTSSGSSRTASRSASTGARSVT